MFRDYNISESKLEDTVLNFMSDDKTTVDYYVSLPLYHKQIDGGCPTRNYLRNIGEDEGL